MKFLQYDSAFMTMLRKVTDYFLLGLLWLVVSLGVVTFGAATTAMFYTADKSIRRDEGKMFMTFWRSFRREFKQGTMLWLISIPPMTFLGFNVVMLWGVELPSLIFALLLVACVICFFWISLWYGYLSRFKDSVRTILWNTFRMVFAYLPWVAVLGVVTAAAIAAMAAAVWYIPPVAFVLPGVYCGVSTALLNLIFKAHLPVEEKPAEEKTAEE